MLKRWAGLRLWFRIAVIAVLVFAVLAASAYAYFAIRTSGAPAPARLGEAPAPAGGPTSLEGDWIVAAKDGGFAGYRVREVLGLVPAPNDAVGRTTDVRGRLRIAAGRIESGEVTVDLTGLRSDEPGRDPAAQMALATDRFPEGRFRLTKPIDLRSPTRGEVVDVLATGELRLRGVTRRVDVPLQVRWNGDSFQMAGHVEIRRTDFDLQFPQQLGMRVSDSADIELELTFVHPGGEQPAATPPTPGSEEEESTRRREAVARGAGRLVVAMLTEDQHTLVYSVDLDGSDLRALTRPADEAGYWTVDSHPVASADGRRVVFSRLLDSPQFTQPPEILVLRIGTTRPRPLLDADGDALRGISPVFSADGARIAWVVGGEDSGSIQVMNRDGSSGRSATDGLRPDEDPALSPDGTRVAFASFTQDGNNDIFVVNADGTGRKRLTATRAYDLTPAWSPDGRSIAFGRDGDIYVMAADGTRARALTSGPARDGAPSWSPDGKRIAFVRSDETGRSEGGPSRVIVMNADGSRERRVPLPGPALSPSWLP